MCSACTCTNVEVMTAGRVRVSALRIPACSATWMKAPAEREREREREMKAPAPVLVHIHTHTYTVSIGRTPD